MGYLENFFIYYGTHYWVLFMEELDAVNVNICNNEHYLRVTRRIMTRWAGEACENSNIKHFKHTHLH